MILKSGSCRRPPFEVVVASPLPPEKSEDEESAFFENSEFETVRHRAASLAEGFHITKSWAELKRREEVDVSSFLGAYSLMDEINALKKSLGLAEKMSDHPEMSETKSIVKKKRRVSRRRSPLVRWGNLDLGGNPTQSPIPADEVETTESPETVREKDLLSTSGRLFEEEEKKETTPVERTFTRSDPPEAATVLDFVRNAGDCRDAAMAFGFPKDPGQRKTLMFDKGPDIPDEWVEISTPIGAKKNDSEANWWTSSMDGITSFYGAPK